MMLKDGLDRRCLTTNWGQKTLRVLRADVGHPRPTQLHSSESADIDVDY